MTLQEEIIELINNRDERGMELLYDNYSNALFAIAMSIVRNQKLAEDVLQKSFVKVWINIDKYKGSKGALFTWLSALTRNTALDMKKSKSYTQSQRTNELNISIHESSASQISSDGMDVESLLQHLEPKYKLVLDYVYLKGYTQQELSDEKGIPLGTIKTRLKKALELVRTYLGPEIIVLLLGCFLNLLNHSI